MDDRKEFIEQANAEIKNMVTDTDLHKETHNWLAAATKHNYTYHFQWMGLPLIQLPQDIVAMQELIWNIKPDCIIETGVARGGSLVLYAGMLKMMDIQGKVIGIDIDIRAHNRDSLENHPLYSYIELVEGSSIDLKTLEKVKELTKDCKNIIVLLDSMHTHEHVLKELELYTPFIKKGGYCIVFDTLVEHHPEIDFSNRPWGLGNNPKTAVWEFLKSNNRFEIDNLLYSKLQISSAPDGYLKCVKD